MKEGWEILSLADVCEFQRGLTYSKGDEAEFSGNVVLRANNVDLLTNQLDLSELKYISDQIQIPSSKVLKPGSLLICTASGSKSHLGKVAFVDKDYGYAFGGFMGQITPLPSLLPRFLFHVLTSEAYKKFISALSDGANINNLKFDDLARFQVPVPPLPEQQRIVALLDEAFASLATAKANAERSLQNARAVFESHLAVTFSQRGDGWAEMSLDEVVDPSCTLSYGIVQPGEDHLDGLPVVRPTDLAPKVICLEGLKRIDPRRAEGYRRTTLQGSELLLCVRGSTGLVSIAAPELRGANVTRGIVPVRFNPDLVLPELGYYLMKSGHVQSQIREKTYGAALMQINIRDLRAITLFVPSLKEQSVMALTMSELDAEVQHLTRLYERKLAALEELKRSLLQQAFNGEL